jgi:hypothetical protein
MFLHGEPIFGQVELGCCKWMSRTAPLGSCSPVPHLNLTSKLVAALFWFSFNEVAPSLRRVRTTPLWALLRHTLRVSAFNATVLVSRSDTSCLSAAINASLYLQQMTGQLARIQGLVKGHAGNVSVFPNLLSLFNVTALVSSGFFPLQS